MKNIIRSILYDILKSKTLIRVCIYILLADILIVIFNVKEYMSTDTDSGVLLADTPTMLFMFSIIVMGIVVGKVASGDFNDKVISYEISTGHSRLSLYYARGILAIVLGTAAAVAVGFIPIIICVIFGWGDTIDLGDVIGRYLLCIFPFIRISAFMVCASFVIKNYYVCLSLGLIINEVFMLLFDAVDNSTNYSMGMYNVNKLLSLSEWHIYNLEPSKGVVNYYSYVTEITPDLVINTILFSVGAALVYLFVGYIFFRRDDLK